MTIIKNSKIDFEEKVNDYLNNTSENSEENWAENKLVQISEEDGETTYKYPKIIGNILFDW